MNFRVLIPFALSLVLAACGDDEESSGSTSASQAHAPDEVIEAVAAAARRSDLSEMLALVAPPSEIEALREEFAQSQAEPVDPTEAAEFAATMEKLTAPDAAERMMAELEPQLAQLSVQMPMLVGMGQMLTMQAINEREDLTEEQKRQATAGAQALFGKLSQANLGSPELAAVAIDEVVETARAIDLETLDEVRELDFEQALGKAATVFEGLKEVLRVYQIDLDEVFNSVNAELLHQQGDEALVRVNYSLFGSPQTTEAEMVRIDGRWYGRTMIENFERARAEAVASAAPVDQDL